MQNDSNLHETKHPRPPEGGPGGVRGGQGRGKGGGAKKAKEGPGGGGVGPKKSVFRLWGVPPHRETSTEGFRPRL